MSSVLSEYPEALPAPMVGVVTPTERRKVGSIGGVQSFRTVQRDRHGTRTYAFTFTKEQAAIFRDWWAEWEQRGGGWFAANWPLPWSRGPNVFRFKNPPEWSLIGGGIDGQGYWRVSGSVEIRGRGMLPTVEVLYLTSTPYPIVSEDAISIDSTASAKLGVPLQIDGASITSEASFYERDTYRFYGYSEAAYINSSLEISARIPLQSISISPESIKNISSLEISARSLVVQHRIAPEAISITSGVSINAN